ncbi:MAG: hypothetical protein U0271_10705 [Polyangiaceae bacterium]
MRSRPRRGDLASPDGLAARALCAWRPRRRAGGLHVAHASGARVSSISTRRHRARTVILVGSKRVSAAGDDPSTPAWCDAGYAALALPTLESRHAP